MHQFKLALTLYTEEGAPTSNRSEVYCDSAETLSVQYRKYSSMKHESGMKMYRVTPQVAVYSDIDDIAAFLANFNIVI